MRCIRANRTCGGYEGGGISAFRQYGAQGTIQVSPFSSKARKCSMPMRIPISGTGMLPPDAIPPETSDAESNQFALRSFLYDFCIISTNKNISRGYLPNLENISDRLGPQSDLVKACQAVSFASHGKPLCRPQLVHKAEVFYQEILGAFAKSIQIPETANAAGSKLIAMLLGIYQVLDIRSQYGTFFAGPKLT
jgi:hypothetical protein